MRASALAPALHAGPAVAVTAFGVVHVAQDALAALRQNLGPPAGPPLAPTMLRNADEQTLAGLAAVFRAAEAYGLQGRDFSEWGVISATRFLGRAIMAPAIARFCQGGASTVSPHIIPHHSPHSTPGSLTIALRARGPSFGVGGGPGHLGEALLAALTLPGLDALPGTWLVVSEWDPELALDADGRGTPAAVLHAVALALAPCRAGQGGLQLRLHPGRAGSDDHGPPTVAGLARALTERTVWQYRVEGGGVVELTDAAANEAPRPAECLP